MPPKTQELPDSTFSETTERLLLPSHLALERALEILQRGGVVAFPTDTVYGVAAHAFLPKGVARLYAVKDRPRHLPIPLLLPDARAMESICIDIPSVAWQLAERFWPGGLSLVLCRAPTVPDIVTAGGATIAVRVPDHPLVSELCRRLGVPLAATSGNRHGQPAPVTADQVGAALNGRVPLILDGGPCPGGVASTLLDLTVSPPAILRQGPITPEQLAEVVSLSG
jgi:L-threonylcarbamoyladenylate synthase